MTGERRDPLIIDLEDRPLPPAPAPAEAPPPPDSTAPGGPGAAERAIRAAGGGGMTTLARLFWAAFLGLAGLWLATSVEGFIGDLFSRADWLGWAASGLLGVLLLALAGLILRELAGLARIGRIGDIRALADRVAGAGGAETPEVRADADAALSRLAGLYRQRPEMASGLARLDAARADTPDPASRLAVAERLLMSDLDAAAEKAVARAARRVAGITALVPMPAVDVIAVLAANLGMIRQVAEIYGGRAGTLGSWRLMRVVAQHLLATGAVAATDDLLGPMVGGGVLGRLSRRFGEAAVNAALTARVGVAAIEVCRPLPFTMRRRPKAASLVLDALKGWREGGKAEVARPK